MSYSNNIQHQGGCMSDQQSKLTGKWLKLYEQCLKSKGDFPYSNLDGFEELYSQYLYSGMLVKQKANKTLSITKASNIADRAAQHAITHARASFKDRCKMEPIVEAIRQGTVMQIPGSKKIATQGGKAFMDARFVYIVLAIKTHTLSALEVKNLIGFFDSDLIDYDVEKWTLTIRTFELHLEEMEPTLNEVVELDKVSRSTIPSVISYIHSTQSYNADWKGFYDVIVERVRDKICSVFKKVRATKTNLDIQAIEDLFESDQKN